MSQGRFSKRGSSDSVLQQGREIPSDLYQQMQANGSQQQRAVQRPNFTETQLEEAYELQMSPQERKERMKDLKQQRMVGKEEKDGKAVALSIVNRILPCIKLIANYNFKQFFVFDLLSGLSVGLFAIPQAIAYALLANVKPQYGFYSAFFGMAIYFIFGTSQHLNMTHQGAVSLLVGESVRAGVEQAYAGSICANESLTSAATLPATTTAAGFAASAVNEVQSCVNQDDANIMVSVTLTMVAGVTQLLLGFLQFGFITIYLSDPLNSAFTCGAAWHILSSQLANILGTTIPPISSYGKFFLYFVEGFKKLFEGDVHWLTIGIFFGFAAVMLAVKLINEKCSKYVKIPIPIDILVLVSSLLMSIFLGWQAAGVAVVGDIPRGFEAPRTPQSEHFTTGSGIVINGIVLAIISYSLSVSVAKTFATKHGYEVDSNQEMIAYGAVNFGMSWFNTFCCANSMACTSLHESMRGKTLVYSVYAVIVTLIGILFLAPQFAPVPKCVLTVIIIINLKNLMLQFEQLPGLWRTNRYDFAIWIVTLGAILGLDLPLGLATGVVFSLATVIFRSQAPKAYLLGRVPKTDIYKNIKKSKAAEEIPGVKIFKFDGSLYFSSAENFRQRLYTQVAMNPKKMLLKAKAHAKSEGRQHQADLRTDVLHPEDIKDVLDKVQTEGQQVDPVERVKAQRNSQENLAESGDQVADWQPQIEEEEEAEPTVNVFCIILDLAACAFTDAVGIRLLKQIVDDFNSIGIEIYLSGCSSLVRSQLRKGGLFKKRDETGVFVTVHDAVLYALSTFYKELLEDEIASINDVPQAAASSSEVREARFSIASNASGQADAREQRRLTRKISRQRNPDELLQQQRRVSQRLRSLEGQQQQKQEQEQQQQKQEQEQQQQQSVQKNKYSPEEAGKPLPVFDNDDADSVEAERRREREARDEARLRSLPTQEHDNAAFEAEATTDM